MTTGPIIYLKCIIAGGIAVIASAIAVSAVAVVGIVWMSRRPEEGTSYGWDPVAFARTPLAWTIFLLVFAAGFYWQFHRTVAH
jgi:F0F1-type ATP synthase membrane subunit c/vacuolar-type H+-ATPase subunit K